MRMAQAQPKKEKKKTNAHLMEAQPLVAFLISKGYGLQKNPRHVGTLLRPKLGLWELPKCEFPC